jgi:hypothetical protein
MLATRSRGVAMRPIAGSSRKDLYSAEMFDMGYAASFGSSACFKDCTYSRIAPDEVNSTNACRTPGIV